MVHVILDNYAAEKHPNVRAGSIGTRALSSASRPHRAPGSMPSRVSSPHFPGEARNVGFPFVIDLPAAINCFPAETNAEPKPFTWTADPDKIIVTVQQGTKCQIRSTRYRNYPTELRGGFSMIRVASALISLFAICSVAFAQGASNAFDSSRPTVGGTIGGPNSCRILRRVAAPKSFATEAR